MLRTRERSSNTSEVVDYRDSGVAMNSLLNRYRDETSSSACLGLSLSVKKFGFGAGDSLLAKAFLGGDYLVFDDVNERKLQDVASRLIKAREEERSRLARDLHDDLSQKMALLSIEIERLRRTIPTEENLNQRLTALQDKVEDISTDIRRISHKLHPVKLDHLGLAAAVNSLCRDFNDAGELRVDFHRDGNLDNLPMGVSLCIYRIVQEALRNCTKHSGAEMVYIRLERTAQELRLTVSDNGRGLDVNSRSVKQGLGLTSMHERVRAADGRIVIRSKPGLGTSIEVSLPLGGKSNESITAEAREAAVLSFSNRWPL